MPKTVKQLQHGPARKKAGSDAFPCLHDLLARHGQSTPERLAILAPGRPPVTFGALYTQAHNRVAALRRLGVGPNDRVAVVLPNGPDAAIATIAVATGMVCVPLNPGYTTD